MLSIHNRARSSKLTNGTRRLEDTASDIYDARVDANSVTGALMTTDLSSAANSYYGYEKDKAPDPAKS